METVAFVGFILLTIILGVTFWWRSKMEEIVYDYQKGILFHNGRFVRVVNAGIYRLARQQDYLVRIDIRPTLFTVPGQEVLTKDKISIKLTAGGNYAVTDTHVDFSSGVSYVATLYAEAQSAIRDVVQAYELENLLGDRTEINAALHKAVQTKATAIGLDLRDFSIRDIMLPAGLKKAFGGILEAQKEAQISIEKARGEQAVLRSLANSSRLYSEHPTLLSARLIQALDRGAHTLVFNSDPAKTAIVSPRSSK